MYLYITQSSAQNHFIKYIAYKFNTSTVCILPDKQSAFTPILIAFLFKHIIPIRYIYFKLQSKKYFFFSNISKLIKLVFYI